MSDLQPLTKTEKINCRAYDKLYIDIQSFIRTRFLNADVNAKCAKETIKIIIDNVTCESLDNFFKPYI